MVPYDVAFPVGFEDIARRIPDTTKLREAFGWSPKRDLKQIITDVTEFERHR